MPGPSADAGDGRLHLGHHLRAGGLRRHGDLHNRARKALAASFLGFWSLGSLQSLGFQVEKPEKGMCETLLGVSEWLLPRLVIRLEASNTSDQGFNIHIHIHIYIYMCV